MRSAISTARMLEAQTLLIVSAGTSLGSPAPTAACRVRRILGQLQRNPVRLGLDVPRDDVLDREGEEGEDGQHEQAEGNSLRLAHATSAARHPRDDERPREREERVPGDALPEVF